MKRLLAALLICGGIVAFAADAPAADKANGAITQEGVTSINNDMKVDDGGSYKLMLDAFEAFRKELNIKGYGVRDSKGRTYFTGEYFVQANSASPDFIKSRAMAYRRAYRDAVSKLVMNIAGKYTTTEIRELFTDDSSDAYEEPKDLKEARSQTLSKIKALAENKLDALLEKNGVDPSKYNIQKKRELLNDSIITKSVRKAFMNLSGFLPIQTFETCDGKGQYNIGLVLRTDPVTTEIAQCIARQRKPVLTGKKGIPIDEALPSDDELLHMFGVRLFFDENGNPCLLSFGQWGIPSTARNERDRQRAFKTALNAAQREADTQLDFFINSTTRVVNESESGESEKRAISFDGNGVGREEDVQKIVDVMFEQSETMATGTMTGRSNVRECLLKHPSGHWVAVVVRQWSFSELENQKAILENKPPKEKDAPAKPQDQGQKGVKKGRVYDF